MNLLAMNYNDVVPLGLVAIVVLWVGGLLFFCFASAFLGKAINQAWSLWRTFVLMMVAALSGAVALAMHAATIQDQIRTVRAFRSLDNELEVALVLFARGLLVFVGVILGAKIFEKAVNGRLSDEERLPGAAGVRAWLSWSNLVAVILIALCAWFAYDFTFWGSLLLGLIAILVYPLFNSLMGNPMTAESTESLSPERERVLRLLEQGKITAEESAELLNALAVTLPPRPTAEPFTVARKLLLIGAAIVVAGFFLPWFSFNPMQKLQQLTSSMTASGQMPMQRWAQPGQVSPLPNMIPDSMQMSLVPGADMFKSLATAEIQFRGGDVGNGLGWIVLVLAIAAAGVPYVLTGARRETRRIITIACTSAGVLIVAYLMTSNFSDVSFGLPVVLAGYLLLIAGALKEIYPVAAVAVGFPVVVGNNA